MKSHSILNATKECRLAYCRRYVLECSASAGREHIDICFLVGCVKAMQ